IQRAIIPATFAEVRGHRCARTAGQPLRWGDVLKFSLLEPAVVGALYLDPVSPTVSNVRHSNSPKRSFRHSRIISSRSLASEAGPRPHAADIPQFGIRFSSEGCTGLLQASRLTIRSDLRSNQPNVTHTKAEKGRPADIPGPHPIIGARHRQGQFSKVFRKLPP